jgi:hypothetical protein
LKFFLWLSILKRFFFHLKPSKEFVAQFRAESGGIVALRHVPGGPSAPGGTLPNATTTDLSQNSNKFLKVLKGKKSFQI